MSCMPKTLKDKILSEIVIGKFIKNPFAVAVVVLAT